MNLKSLMLARKLGGGASGGSDAEKYFEDLHEEVVLPNATKIKKLAFYNDGILKNITMPKIKEIGFSAFCDCKNLALTSLPDGVTSIESNAFDNCYNLALASLPSGITKIGNSAFSSCQKLVLISLPEGVTNIGSKAFYSCLKLALTSLPSGITNIGSQAFYNCKGLTSLTFKGTPTTIADNAFQYSPNLTTINVPWAEGAVANAPWGATNATINYNYTGE